MALKTIIGYRKFKSKKGEEFCIVQASEPYSKREEQYGAYGDKVEDVFIPKDYHNLIDEFCIGKKLALTYTIQGGKAYIDSVEIK